MRSCDRLNSAASQTWFAPTCVAVFTLVLCAVTISPASNFDGFMVWRFCQRILQGVPYDESIWDHRTARFGVVVPALITQMVFGTSIAAYYTLTSLTTAAATTATFLLGRTVVNAWVGVAAALSVALLPMMSWFSDCQLTAELYSMTFVPLCLLYGYRYAQEGKSAQLWACAGLFGICYFAKETNVFFAPGILWLLFRGAPQRWKALAVFCGVNLALFSSETALYRLFTEQRLGRASVILGNHLNNRAPIEEPLPSLWHLFRRFTELRFDVALPIYLFLAACVWIYMRERRAKWSWVIVPALSFLFLTTFGVRSLDPIKLVQPFRDRYMLPALGLEFIVVWAVVDVWGLLDPFKRWLLSRPRRGTLIGVAAALVTLCVAHVGLRALNRHAPSEEQPFRREVTRALEQGTPMIAPAGDRKTMLYIQSFLWQQYQPPHWQVFSLENQREVMLPVSELLSREQAAQTLREYIGRDVLNVRYNYVYRANSGVLEEKDFETAGPILKQTD